MLCRIGTQFRITRKKDTPKVPDSTTNAVEIDFTSDAAHEATGFRVEWESVKAKF